MAHMDPLDLALMDGVGDAVERVADDPVTPLYAGCLQCFDQYIGHPFTHCATSRVVGPCSATPTASSAEQHTVTRRRRIPLRRNLATCNSAIYCARVARGTP